MRKALPKGLVRVNLYLGQRRDSKFDFLRGETEASSDSEVLRQALRHFEQFVQDSLGDIKLKAMLPGETIWLTVAQFRENGEAPSIERRSMILHEKSLERIKGLQVAMAAKDTSEVARAALRFYARLVELCVHQDAHCYVVMPSGESLRLRLNFKLQTSNAKSSG